MRRTIVVAVAGALLLAACGSSDNKSATGAQAGGSSQTTIGDMPGMGGGNTSCSPSGTTLSIVASGTKFSTDCLAAPAGQALTLKYENKDSIAHNIVFLESHTATEVLFRADIFTGPKTMALDVPALKAGTFAFHCEVHPGAMSGTLVVK